MPGIEGKAAGAIPSCMGGILAKDTLSSCLTPKWTGEEIRWPAMATYAVPHKAN